MALVTFEPSEFRKWYPEFKNCPDERLNEFFAEACLFLNNTDNSPIEDINVRKLLLYLLTAHMAQIFFGVNGQPPTGIVGRIDSATEGTVSVHAAMEGISQNSAWFMQTPYGAKFWAATSPFRSMRYFPGGSPSFYPTHYYRRYGRGYRW